MLIKNISRLVTMCPASDREGSLGVIANACLCARNGMIEWFGAQKDLPSKYENEIVVDAGGKVVMPGLVDCHTHLVFAGSRVNEFNERSQGKTYKQIAAEGGGIMFTVRATRAATEDELFFSAIERTNEAFRRGITTLEVKTGYGLDVETELKMARVIKRLQEIHKNSVFGTFLGAHAVPAEFKGRKEEYVEILLNEMLPKIAEVGSISACDIFIEEIAFSADDARRIAKRAAELGMKIHLHVDQFCDVGGAKLAAELSALSADHLDESSLEGLRLMKEKGVAAVLLPLATCFAGLSKYASARKMISEGLCVAISTDYNPGTAPSLNLFLSATVGVTQMGMTCDEALLSITKNAAQVLALSDRGEIAVGKRADVIVLECEHEYESLYWFGKNLVSQTFLAGKAAF